jgi:hypothetical protein
MLPSTHLVSIPYTSDLTSAGVAFACQALGRLPPLPSNDLLSRLQTLVVDSAIQIAFQRFLSENGVDFLLQRQSPFAEPSRLDIFIGGRRCNLVHRFISQRSKIVQIKNNPACLLELPFILPVDHYSKEDGRETDIFLYSFVLGLVANRLTDMKNAATAGQPHFLLFLSPAAWSHPEKWVSLGKLTMKSEATSRLPIRLYGRDRDGKFIREEVSLRPLKVTPVQAEFYSISCLHSDVLPNARVGLRSPTLQRMLLPSPKDWKNLWVYGMEIVLAGYTTRREFRRIAASNRSNPYSSKEKPGHFIPASALHPIADILEEARRWAAGQPPA